MRSDKRALPARRDKMTLKKLFTTVAICTFSVAGFGCGEKPEPPVPTEASDPNAITFDDGDFEFAAIHEGDPDSAKGADTFSPSKPRNFALLQGW